MTAIALAFAAGVLSILSPCVLPLVPLVLGAASAADRYGPAMLAAGLALSFTLFGLFIATIGFSLGIDAGVVRIASAVVMIALGAVLLVPRFQTQFAFAGGSLSNWADRNMAGAAQTRYGGQFLVGVLLGAVWSPCVGPTLGAASLLAAQGKDLPQVALTMLAFGIGAGLPLALLGLVSASAMARFRNRMLSAGSFGKMAMGVILIAVGLAVATGADKRIESTLVDISPAWLTELTTRF
ncbi:MAG: cytochrome C biogenesis protein [Proteobacteria bacterium SG_bin9]|nr:MAG: cytochrome C biogenesis protein [Proteobacteria bacterium SG_bin9]